MIVNRVIHKKWIKIEKRCKPLIEKRKKQKKQEFKRLFSACSNRYQVKIRLGKQAPGYQSGGS